MPEYLFTARSAKGRSMTDLVGARTIGDARRALEAQGFTDILFHTDNEQLRVNRQMQEQMDPHALVGAVEARYERFSGSTARRPGSSWSTEVCVWIAPWLVLLLIPSILSIWIFAIKRNPLDPGLWLGILVQGGVGFIVCCVVLALSGHRAQIRAATWNRVERTRFWTAFLKCLPPIGRPPLSDLDLRLATVLARNGRVEEGRRLVAPYLAQAATDAMLLGRVAHFHHAAGESERALEFLGRAVEVSNGSTQALVDQAYFLARHLERPAEAEAVLGRLRERELIELARVFVWFTRGLILLQQGQPAGALAAFAEADKHLAPHTNVALLKGMQLELYAFRALACAAVGQTEEGRRWFRRARPLLEARRETALLARLHAALGQSHEAQPLSVSSQSTKTQT